jgi:CheY-like chemotaxis protein
MAQPLIAPRETILVVDDNPFVFRVVRLSLTHAGFTVLAMGDTEVCVMVSTVPSPLFWS